jgi:hypothetical protein
VHAFAGPAFVGGAHPLARVRGVTNGIVIAAAPAPICLTGPGAGPDVTADTLLDDVAELVAERRVRTPPPEPSQSATSVTRPHTAWFLRVNGGTGGTGTKEADVADLLGSYGIWSTRMTRRDGRIYVLTCAASYGRAQSACDALGAATGAAVVAFPAVAAGGEDAAC